MADISDLSFSREAYLWDVRDFFILKMSSKQYENIFESEERERLRLLFKLLKITPNMFRIFYQIPRDIA